MLWKRMLEWARYVLKHKEQTEKNTADIKEQQQAFDEMTAVVQRLAFELERLRDNEVHEREKMALRLENILLRERSLPPGNRRKASSTEELLKLVEDLKRETVGAVGER
jgi:hypothetical protein